MSYRPPIYRRPGLGGSPGQIILVVVLVVLALIIYSGTGNLGALQRSALHLAVLFPALVMSLAFHEFAHALLADRLGDDTARRQGRLTLDPRVHLDPLGTFMLVITVILGFGIGWAKPVPVQPWRLRIGPRIGMAIVAIAGPISNLLISFLAVRAVMLLSGTSVPDAAVEILMLLAGLNIALAVFNMLPIPPLDGYRVLLGILPERTAASFQQIEPYGPMILLFVVFMGQGLIGGIIRLVGGPLLRAMAA